MDDLITWDIIWRIRQRGLVPSIAEGWRYESDELKHLCAKWCELQKQQNEIDKRFKEMASPETGERQ